MKKALLLLLFVLPLYAAAQKSDVKIKDDTVLVNDTLYALVEREGCGFGSSSCTYTFFNKAHKKVLIIKPDSYRDPGGPSKANPNGMVPMLVFTFLESDQKVEVRDFFAIKTDKVARFIVKNELFRNGEINPEALRNFVAVYR